MIFANPLPNSNKRPPKVARQLSKITLLGELIIPPTDNYAGGVTRPVLTLTTWGSVKRLARQAAVAVGAQFWRSSMDPNANMAEQESLILRGMENSPRMWALRNALAEWLAAGGFDPNWSEYPKAAAYWGEA